MTAQFGPALIAALAAVVASLLVFVPFVAFQYRRSGGLSGATVARDFAGLLYALGLLSYTLLPLPVASAAWCATNAVAPQLIPFHFVGDIVKEQHGGVAALLTNPALLQVILNIALFVPLGFMVRHFGRRPIVIAILTGTAVSLFIELTQLTGDWTIFPCAYRLFDVDDLLANTVGAALGGLLAGVLAPAHSRSQRAAVARPLTALRRLIGMTCDVGFVWVSGGSLVAAYALIVLAMGASIAPPIDNILRYILGWVVPVIMELAVLLCVGRTVGEWCVRIRISRFVRGGRAILRWAAGIGGFTLLSSVPSSGMGLLTFGWLVASVVLVFTSRNHRGLANMIAGWSIEDDRTGAIDPRIIDDAGGYWEGETSPRSEGASR